jgi:hypothetical protein
MMKIIFGLMVAVLGLIGFYGYAMHQEARSHEEMALVLANLNAQKEINLTELEGLLDENQYRLEETGLALMISENETVKYRNLYADLDRHFNDYLRNIPRVTVLRNQVSESPDGIVLERPGEYNLCLVEDTGSMRPILEKGFVVLLESTGNVHIGDIAVYQREDGAQIIHRIIGEEGDFWIFRGDANLYDDPPVPKENVIWRLVAVFY